MEAPRINLFHMSPLYAFSSTTALTAVSLTFALYGWYTLNPEILRDPFSLGVALLVTALALVTFIGPLLGVHRLLVAEKIRLLDETALHFEAVIAGLHQGLSDGDSQRIDEMNKSRATSRSPTPSLSSLSLSWLSSPSQVSCTRPVSIGQAKGIEFNRQTTLVSAPAGFGKTSCFSEWVNGLDDPVTRWGQRPTGKHFGCSRTSGQRLKRRDNGLEPPPGLAQEGETR